MRLSQCGPHCHSEKSLLFTLNVDLAFCKPSVAFDCSLSARCSLPMVHFTERRGEGRTGTQWGLQESSSGLIDSDFKQEVSEG